MAVSLEFRRTYQHGTLVIWPPDDLRSIVGELRRRFDPASQAICDAHITMTMPFAIYPSGSDLDRLSDVVALHVPITVEYGPLASFLPYPCVYLEIRPQDRLRSLQSALYDLGLFNLSLPFSDPNDYIFHMSITDGYPDEAQSRHILASLEGFEPRGTFEVSSVEWIVPDSDFRFAAYRRFPFEQ
ncbi:MAG: 2'-5' RNA ligase family protein [Thermomicrobiales bacterium]